MSVDERTSLLNAKQNGHNTQNGNGWQKNGKLFIQMPKDPVCVLEEYWGSLTLGEILPYQDDPWWQRLRNAFFYSFWISLMLTLITACAMAYFHGSTSCKVLYPTLSTSTVSVVTGKVALAP